MKIKSKDDNGACEDMYTAKQLGCKRAVIIFTSNCEFSKQNKAVKKHN